jgi:uncharacterized protein (DUF952 family)/mannose-6-phosphate isomerase-like protein (cupin superfamily)
MPKIIGKAHRVVEIDGVLSIDEYVGNVGSKQDDLSIAVVKINQPNAEPWLTLDYDEWMVVLKGFLEIHFYDQNNENKQVLTVNEGETVFIPKGERFQPVFPQAGAEYVPVCIPAFRPDRCLREEEAGINTSDIAENLARLHKEAAAAPMQEGNETSNSGAKVTSVDTEIVYHMCQQALWETALESGKAYFPPTFQEDGFFTHATAVPARLLETANHFYTATEGSWICLELSVERLHDLGIMTLFEEPKPVGDQVVSDSWQSNKWACPHIYGGIPVSVDGIVTKTFDMKRDTDGNFLSIVGLTDH